MVIALGGQIFGKGFRGKGGSIVREKLCGCSVLGK